MNPSNNPSSNIIQFYQGTGVDHVGRSLNAIRAFNPHQLETVHDYIQWLFPLMESSRVNPMAPLLTLEDIAVFRADRQLRFSLLTSLNCMLACYGLIFEESANWCSVRKSEHYTANKSTWLTPSSHHFLRISRILRSLSILGCRREAQAFLAELEEIFRAEEKIIGSRSMDYWRQAVKTLV